MGGAELPLSGWERLEDEPLSTPLGQAAHLVALLAKYMAVPLRFRIVVRGSRSYLMEEAVPVVGPTAFPLFARGQRPEHFRQGVAMLIGNIAQIAHHCGLPNNLRADAHLLCRLIILFEQLLGRD